MDLDLGFGSDLVGYVGIDGRSRELRFDVDRENGVSDGDSRRGRITGGEWYHILSIWLAICVCLRRAPEHSDGWIFFLIIEAWRSLRHHDGRCGCEIISALFLQLLEVPYITLRSILV